METSAPWMEPFDLEPSDLPVEMADFFGLDKDNTFEQLVEIRSPVQELENVETLPAFCMLEPEVHIDAPEFQEVEPTPPEEEPTPEEEERTPPEEEPTPLEEEPTPPEEELTPLEDRNDSPSPDFLLEPIVQITTPEVEVVEPKERQIVSPEVFMIEDSPEKQENHSLSVEDESVETMKQPICDDPSDVEVKQELRVRLRRIDETLTIIDNRVILPPHMCGSDSRRSSRASSSSSKSRGRRDRTATNNRKPYSLRIKPEPTDNVASSSNINEVRFNPYVLSAQKMTANKRATAARGKQTKSKQTQLPQSRPDEDFLPTDFLEASMSEGVSSTKQQPWPGSLLEKTLKTGTRQPAQIARNGTPMFVNAAGGDKAGVPLQRLSSFRGGIVRSEASEASSYDSVAKVMANSSVSITNVLKAGKALTIIPTRKGPGQSMMNYDQLYSRATIAEEQRDKLLAENAMLRKQIKAANQYIATSLGAAVNKTPPLHPYQAQPQSRVQAPRPIRVPAHPLRAQAMIPQQQAIRVQQYRGQTARPQSLRAQVRMQPIRGQTFRPRPPLTITQRPGNPGVMVVPARTVRPLTASTQALTVIPIRKGPRVSDPDIVMPSFEQVNVNEHFGMHFLTEG